MPALTLVLLLASAVVIYLSCELFVNGIEWVGRKLNVSETATGTVLAAFGTALPESVVTFVAVTLGTSDAEREIGVGAAVGGPLVLSTIAYAVVGVTLILCCRRIGRADIRIEVDHGRLARDQGWFLAIFLAKVALGLTAFAGKRWLGIPFLAVYGVYFWTELRGHGGDADPGMLEPLRLRPRDSNPRAGWAILQTVVALAVIFGASRVFVSQLDGVGHWLGLAPQLVALLLSPIATELPETMNAVIWTRQGKDRLALANISGAMMIQATVPTAFGLLFTPWLFDRSLVIAAGATILAIVMLIVMFRRGAVTGRQLVWNSLFYLLFVLGIILF